jgi:arylsulfatase A-like enzyme
MKRATLFAGLLCAVAVPAAGQAPRPNIVLVMADNRGWGETGSNGHPYLRTPVLDEMARTGLRLDRFYAASPVCSPTRASVVTGRHANRSGAFAANWSTRPEEVTIAQILRQAGYRTGHSGKWHLGPPQHPSVVQLGQRHQRGRTSEEQWKDLFNGGWRGHGPEGNHRHRAAARGHRRPHGRGTPCVAAIRRAELERSRLPVTPAPAGQEDGGTNDA